MTISQKRAIWYRERDRRNRSIDDFLIDYGLQQDYYNSKYRTRTGYMKHIMKQLEPDKKYIHVNDKYIHATMAMNGKYRSKVS